MPSAPSTFGVRLDDRSRVGPKPPGFGQQGRAPLTVGPWKSPVSGLLFENFGLRSNRVWGAAGVLDGGLSNRMNTTRNDSERHSWRK